MRKKLLAAMLAIACASACAGVFAACNDGDKAEHEHDFAEEWTPSADGTKHYHKCKVEGCTVVSGSADHDFEEAIDEATCLEAKTVVSTCKVCGYFVTETDGTPLDHDWGAWEVTAENMPTATEAGTATRRCSRTGCEEVDEEMFELPPLVVDGKINTAYAGGYVVGNTATCDEGGEATYTYNKVGQYVKFKAPTPALGHDWKEEFAYDETEHWVVCSRNPEHVQEGSRAAHDTHTGNYKLKYNSSTGVWEHIYTTTCTQEACKYSRNDKGTETDFADGDTDASNGTYAAPVVLSASNVTERTLTIPANTVISFRYTNSHAMSRYGVLVTEITEGKKLGVVYGSNEVVGLTVGERWKELYIGDRGGSLDFALTSFDGSEITVKFKFIDSDTYYFTGTPSEIVAGTEYSVTLPDETDARYTFNPLQDGIYKLTVIKENEGDSGAIVVEDSRDMITATYDSTTEPLYGGKSYTVTISTNFERTAGTVKFKFERLGDIPQPAEGMQGNPKAISETGEYEVEIEIGTYVAFGKYFAFTPTVSGLYTFADEQSNKTTFNLCSDSGFLNTLTSQMDFSDKDYRYIEYELEAGVTYYLRVSSEVNEDRTANVKISLHEHSFKQGDEWAYDIHSHWKEATCGHDVKSNQGGHTLGADNICTVCGYKETFAYTEGLSFELSSDETYYIVSKGTANISTVDLVIPAEYEGKPVKEIKQNGFNNAYWETVTIPATIEVINSGAFNSCNRLTKIYISDLESWCAIEFKATTAHPFYSQSNGSKDAKIYLNGTVIKDVTVTHGVKAFAFYKCSGIQTVNVSGGNVGNYAFNYGLDIKTVILGEGVETLGTYAFYCCGALTELTIPSSLVKGENNTFGKTSQYPGAQIAILNISDLEAYANLNWTNPLLATGKLLLNGEEVKVIALAEATEFGSIAKDGSQLAFLKGTANTKYIITPSIEGVVIVGKDGQPAENNTFTADENGVIILTVKYTGNGETSEDFTVSVQEILSLGDTMLTKNVNYLFIAEEDGDYVLSGINLAKNGGYFTVNGEQVLVNSGTAALKNQSYTLQNVKAGDKFIIVSPANQLSFAIALAEEQTEE